MDIISPLVTAGRDIGCKGRCDGGEQTVIYRYLDPSFQLRIRRSDCECSMDLMTSGVHHLAEEEAEAAGGLIRLLETMVMGWKREVATN
ncbi:hypothetical protein L6452_07626 [Arctium lappa]|uniref:Uncharacterized protein n=1 Tax=Arctium lappa TaxID=4217 RepID=A0ACB9ELU4_ARCLA|nr:hypothetical protein L6452_07626 [Arctium lappa]